MRKLLLTLAIVIPLSQSAAFAQRKDCEQLKMEIAAKVDAKGVKNYALTIVAAGDVKADANVVGSCDGGAKKIIYTRG